MPNNFTDPGELLVVGENPVMYLYPDPGASPTTSVSVWHALFSPVGPGNVLFWISELIGNEPRLYADNIALARWLQEEILRAGLPYKDSSLPVLDAQFTRLGSIPSFVTERVEARDDVMEFTWYDFIDGYAGHTEPDLAAGETLGHYAVYFPARRAQVVLNGRRADGAPLLRDRDGHATTTCFLAVAESWQKYTPEE